MPIYEYKCPSGHLIEEIHGMTEPGPEACPECGGSPLVRVLHPVAVHFKGSGFYSTDYGKGSRKRDPAKESSSSDGGGGGSEKPAEPKKAAEA